MNTPELQHAVPTETGIFRIQEKSGFINREANLLL